MSRCNLVAVLILVFVSSVVKAEVQRSSPESALSEHSADGEAMIFSPSRDVAAEKETKAHPLASQFEAGLSYVQWNESMGISQGATSTKGYANYAGPGISFEYNRRRARWQWGASTTIAAGKAAAGGFGGFLTFADGVDRLWYGWFLHPFVHYRINPVFMIGGGALARVRIIDWEPADPTLRVEKADQIAAAPTLNLRWTIQDTVTVAQSFALIGLNGETQWTWTAQYVF